MQGQQPGIAALPQPLLVHIIGLLDFWLLRTTMPLVCRAWRDATADADAQLFTCVAVDWSVECRPAPALYPSHRDQPYLDIAAVGRWLARRLPQLAHLHLELRWSQHFNHPAFDQLAVAQDWGPTNTAALLASLAPKLVSLRLLACDNLLVSAGCGCRGNSRAARPRLLVC